MKGNNILIACVVFSLFYTNCFCSRKDRFLPKVDYVSCKYLSESSFKGILEALDGKESKAARVYLRSDSSIREGFYFIVALDGAVGRIKNGTIFTLQYITTDNKHVKEQSWTFDEKHHSPWSEFYAGLTGETDKIASNAKLLAWRCVFKNPDGSIISSKESYAWEMPN